jgi:hypothetical protein
MSQPKRATMSKYANFIDLLLGRKTRLLPIAAMLATFISNANALELPTCTDTETQQVFRRVAQAGQTDTSTLRSSVERLANDFASFSFSQIYIGKMNAPSRAICAIMVYVLVIGTVISKQFSRLNG